MRNHRYGPGYPLAFCCAPCCCTWTKPEFLLSAACFAAFAGHKTTAVSTAATPAYFPLIWNTTDSPKGTLNSALCVSKRSKTQTTKTISYKHRKKKKNKQTTKPECGDRSSPGSHPRREKTECCYECPCTSTSEVQIKASHLSSSPLIILAISSQCSEEEERRRRN